MSLAEYSSDDDEFGGAGPSEQAKGAQADNILDQRHTSSHFVNKTSGNHHRMAGATSAGAAAAVLGAGLALTKLLRRRMMRGRRSGAEEGASPATLLMQEAPRARMCGHHACM